MTCRNQNYRAWEEGIGSTWRERARSYTSTGLCFVDSWSCAGGLSSIVAGDGPCPLLPSMASAPAACPLFLADGLQCGRRRRRGGRWAAQERERERRAGDGRRTGLATPLRFLAVDFAADCRSGPPVLSRASRCPPVPLSHAETRYSRSGRSHYFPLPAVPPQRRALPRSSSRAIFQRQDAFFPDSAPFNHCGAFRRTPRRAQRLNE